MTWTIHHGDWIEQLHKLPSESVHCVVTSPPYWGLRDYGVPGQLGLERTPEEYVAKMVEGFREIRRVLRDDGTCWLNLGDSYAGGGRGGGGCFDAEGPGWRQCVAANDSDCVRADVPVAGIAPCCATGGLVGEIKPKDLIGIPWLVAFALRADGWYLRADIIWAKQNPMPESVKDRPTRAHEYLFLLSKSPRYYYDAEAVKEPANGNAHAQGNGVNPKAKMPGKNSRYWMDRDPAHSPARKNKQNASFSAAVVGLVSRRNMRSVLTTATSPYREAHFATFPPKLVEPCILAGTSERGCCGAMVKRLRLRPDLSHEKREQAIAYLKRKGLV